MKKLLKILAILLALALFLLLAFMAAPRLVVTVPGNAVYFTVPGGDYGDFSNVSAYNHQGKFEAKTQGFFLEEDVVGQWYDDGIYTYFYIEDGVDLIFQLKCSGYLCVVFTPKPQPPFD